MATKFSRMFKRIGYTLLILLSLFGIAGYIGVQKFNNYLFEENANELLYQHDATPIHFDWANDSIGSHVETHVAITIPLKIDGLSNKFYFQFDTGAPSSLIYGKTLASLREHKNGLRTSVKDGNLHLENLNGTLGGNLIDFSMLKVYENYGAAFDVNDTISYIKLGTLGADFIDNKITVIDFKFQSIRIYNERPSKMSELDSFRPFDFAGRRFMLPVTIEGKELELLYDSGCSAFGLITSKSRYDNITEESVKEIEYLASRWGDALPIHHKPTKKKMLIGGSDLDLKRVSYVDMYANYQGFMSPFTRVGGWLGNKPFTESTLIFDTKKEEFTVLKNRYIDE